MTTSAASHTSLHRSRRTPRPSGDERELAILTTAENLLADRPLADISVDDLAKGAGISRPTFYFYFSSKEAVLLTLLDRVVNEADAALQTLAENPEGADQETMWRDGINVFFETFGAHKAVTRACQAVRATSAEVSDLWSTFMQKWISYTATVIDAERERGAAPPTLPSHELATALNQMNERTLFASFASEQPSVPEGRVLDTLVHIWVTSIYGEAAGSR
ncbi:TetR/AcrR family transcriptional regulator [Mycobacterium spongiae]|uniref:HTH-type transcriptional regulator EthR n=1 Tax=Mycobacterium spongiae TaxID=886343 RepID=A0A975K139_9MYCO|nr:TetR/AcrR family transcriptional regulator [Mycobacterium spongiae]QUR69412.1 TetR family transcriptional regulator [Mycobacterium spongiae]